MAHLLEVTGCVLDVSILPNFYSFHRYDFIILCQLLTFMTMVGEFLKEFDSFGRAPG